MDFCGGTLEQKMKETTRRMGREVRFFEETDSTNLQAKMAAQGAGHGTLFVAERQTAGRGRLGRNWESASEGNIYFSLLLKPDFAPDVASQVTLVMGLAVTEVLREYCHADAGLKWPNDVVVKGKKLCGILTELGLAGKAIDYLVVGVGINVGQQNFPEEIAATATSLGLETGVKVNRTELLVRIMNRFENLYEEFVQEKSLAGMRERYNALLLNNGREVRVLDPKGEYTGMAGGITETGELLVERECGTVEMVYAGEVSVRGIYGYV